jgi:hypothetical protein
MVSDAFWRSPIAARMASAEALSPFIASRSFVISAAYNNGRVGTRQQTCPNGRSPAQTASHNPSQQMNQSRR